MARLWTKGHGVCFVCLYLHTGQSEQKRNTQTSTTEAGLEPTAIMFKGAKTIRVLYGRHIPGSLDVKELLIM
jgi:hypothetical protein